MKLSIAPRQMGEMGLRPGVNLIVLRIGEGAPAEGDDLHRHQRLVEVFSQELELPARVAPPTRDFGRHEPAAQARQVGGRDWTE